MPITRIVVALDIIVILFNTCSMVNSSRWVGNVMVYSSMFTKTEELTFVGLRKE